MGMVEVRCPIGPKRLLMKLLTSGARPHYVDGNLLELNCEDCKKLYRRQDHTVKRVLHQYDFLGELIETVIERQ